MSVQIIRPGDRQLAEVDPATTAAPPEQLRGSLRQIVSRSPYVHLASHEAGMLVDTHSHAVDEVMVVLDGDVEVGGTRCEAGTVLVIPANEEYALDVGTAGLTYLVVRPAAHGG